MLIALLAVAAGLAAGLLAGRRPPAEGTGWLPAIGGDLGGGAPAHRTARGRARRPARSRLATAAVLAAGVATAMVGALLSADVAAAGYGLLAAAALRLRGWPGMMVVAAGLVSNLVVVAADGGMPVQDAPPGVKAGALHHGLSTRDALAPLSDVIPVPPLGALASPGDLVVALGAGIAAFSWLRPRRERVRERHLEPGR